MNEVNMYVKLVCDYVRLPLELVTGKCRKREYCEARQLIAFFLLTYTNITQEVVAAKVGYRDHSSASRDKWNVPILFENKEFAKKYNALKIKAKTLAEALAKKKRLIQLGQPGESGDICWFWNANSIDRFPVIGTYERSFAFSNQVRFVCREHPELDFGNCQYVGEKILPEIFQGKVTPKPTTLPIPWNLYYKVNAGAICTA